MLFDLDETLISRGTANLGRVVSFLHAHVAIPDDARPEGGNGGTRGAPSGADPQEVEQARAGALRVPLPQPVQRVVATGYHRLRRRVLLRGEARCVLEALRQAGIPCGVVTNGAAQK